MDLVPIIPDEPSSRRETYNQALTKLLRANDHKIISSYVRYEGSSAHIEIDIQCDKDLSEKFLEIKDLEIKDYRYKKGTEKDSWDLAQDFIDHLRSNGNEPLRYQGDNIF